MKSILFSRLWRFSLLVCCTIQMTACSDDDAEPRNVIKDESGTRIGLTWTTGSTEAEAISVANFDLLLYKEGEAEAYNYSNSGKYEYIFTSPEMPDGTYLATIIINSSEHSGSFRLSVEGRSVKKEYAKEGNFTSGSYRLDYLHIIKAGSKYTIEPVEE